MAAVVSPEAKYNTFSPRFWAGFVDGLVLLPVGIGDAVVFSQKIVWLMIAWIAFSHSVYWLYSVVGHGLYGKTVGKHVMKIVVVDSESETKISWTQAILRDSFLIMMNTAGAAIDIWIIANGVTKLPPSLAVISAVIGYGSLLWFVVEIVTCLTNYKRRAVHDFIAGTVVVRTDSV